MMPGDGKKQRRSNMNMQKKSDFPHFTPRNKQPAGTHEKDKK